MEDERSDPVRRAEEIEDEVAPRREAAEGGFDPDDHIPPDEASVSD